MLGSCSKLKFYIFSKSIKKIVKYIINNLRKTGEKKNCNLYYTTYTRYLLINGHFWEPKIFTVHCWHKISSAKAKNKVVYRRNRDLIFTVSSQSGDRHKIGEREQLQQNIIKILIFGLTCKNSLSLSCDKITMINDLVTLV